MVFDCSGLEDGKAFIEQHDPNFILHIDLSTLDFCYSSVVKVFTSFLMTPMRPVVELALGKQMWQQTSMKMLAQMSPNCSVVQPAAPAAPASDASSSEAGAIEAATPAAPVYCQHTDTRTDEDHFFAPTGNGSIVTMIICTQCGYVLSRTSEYFD